MAGRRPPSPIDAAELMGRSRAVIGFWLAHCFGRPEMMTGPLAELFGMIESGNLRVVAGGSYPLADAHVAHEDLLARRTVGKIVLDVRGG